MMEFLPSMIFFQNSSLLSAPGIIAPIPITAMGSKLFLDIAK